MRARIVPMRTQWQTYELELRESRVERKESGPVRWLNQPTNTISTDLKACEQLTLGLEVCAPLAGTPVRRANRRASGQNRLIRLALPPFLQRLRVMCRYVVRAHMHLRMERVDCSRGHTVFHTLHEMSGDFGR